MSWLQVLILAIVQGVTEFLPISSSGHLVVVGALFEAWQNAQLPDVVEMNILLHVGTLLAILVYFRREIQRLLRQDRRVLGLVILGTIPAVLIGLPLKYFAKELLESPLLTGLLLPVTGALLLWSARRDKGELNYLQITPGQALAIGGFQACALLPGLSRSGFTIVGGLLVGLKRESAATFSFLLAIPAIGGAATLETLELLGGDKIATPTGILVGGMAVSFVVGLVSLAWLIRLVSAGRLYWFAFWCIPLGIIVIGWQLLLWWQSAP